MAKVSILCAVYNHEKYLREAVESVLAQSFSDWELILWDDGSSDQSLNIAKAYQAQYPEKIRAYWHPDHANRGQEYTRNQAAKASQGEFLCLLDSDDGFHPKKLEVLLKALEDPRAGLAYGRTRIRLEATGEEIDPNISRYPTGSVYSKLLEENFVGASAVLFRRECLLSPEGTVLEFDMQYKTCGEYPLWLAIAKRWRFVHVPKVVAWWRFHGENQSAKFELEAKEELVRLFRDLLEKEQSGSQGKKDLQLIRLWIRRRYDLAALQYAHLQFTQARRGFLEILAERHCPAPLRAKALALFGATLLGKRANTRLALAKKTIWKFRNPFEALRVDRA